MDSCHSIEPTASRWEELQLSTRNSDHVTPLFWQHGEDFAVLREEIERMAESGIRSFIVESRPFPDFLGDSWWRTLEFLLSEAKKRNMRLFVFDDSTFPSGAVGGRVRTRHPEYGKRFLREQHIDVIGPRPGTSFQVAAWLENAEERVVHVIAVRCLADGAAIDPESAIDVSSSVHDGVLYFDTPPGRWRICIFIDTDHGGEATTADYINLLDPEPTAFYLEEVYEAHYRHFHDEFGKTFAGFFSDEPRFGNAATYQAVLGHFPMVLPFSGTLMAKLDRGYGAPFARLLPCLWFDGGTIGATAKALFMDVVSELYSENFSRQIGQWCRQHQVLHIGHVIEENGAHCRLGYGAGHFFRAQQGQSWAGCDSVLLQNLPEFTRGEYASSCGMWNSEFFHEGVGKLAASAGHLLPNGDGTVFVELFGAYGWQEGLRLMKWHTDHFVVRGINHLVPHAFSPREFPDSDCPPHFYARNQNPQWRFFKIWAQYAQRLCHLLSGGIHVAPCALLYHAESEWSGLPCQPFEQVAAILARAQLDCDVVPLDLLHHAKVEQQELCIRHERFAALIVPDAQWRPPALLARLRELGMAGLPIYFVAEAATAEIATIPNARVVAAADLNATLRGAGLGDLIVAGEVPQLRTYHYRNAAEDCYFLVNESFLTEVDCPVTLKTSLPGIEYDPMAETTTAWNHHLHLAPGQSKFLIFTKDAATLPLAPPARPCETILSFDGAVTTSTATAAEYPHFTPAPELGAFGSWNAPGRLPRFSGTVRYQCHVTVPPLSPGRRCWLDLGEVYEVAEVWWDGHALGSAIAPPYRFEVTDLWQPGPHELTIDVTNTLGAAFGDNIFDRFVAHPPSGLLGPVRIVAEASAESV